MSDANYQMLVEIGGIMDGAVPREGICTTADGVRWLCDKVQELKNELYETKRERDEAVDMIGKLTQHGVELMNEHISLQRERRELAALLASEKATRNSIIEKGVKTERERDEARADLVAEIKHHWDTTIKIACKLELEHNELREQNAKLRDIAERALNFGEYRAPYLGYPGPTWEKLRAELDQLKEGAKCPVCSPEQKCWECADDVSQEGVE